MSILAAYFFLGCVALIGQAVLLPFTRPALQKPSFPVGLAVGSVVLAYGLFLINDCGCTLTRNRFLAGFGLAVVYSAIVGRPWEWNFTSALAFARRKRSVFATVALSLIFISYLVAWMEASALPIYQLDALAHFAFEAKILFHLGTFHTPFFYDRYVIHEGKDYPLLVPYVEAGYYWFIGRIDDGAVRHLFLGWWAAWLVMLYQALRQKLKEDVSLAILAVVATLPVFLADEPGQAVSGCGDIPFALLWVTAVFAALRWADQETLESRIVMIIAGLGLIFCKPNGLPIVLGLWVLLAIFQPLGKRKVFLASLFLLLAFALPWLRVHIPREVIERSIDWRWATLFQDFRRLLPLFIESLNELSRTKLWGGFWVFVVVSWVVGRHASPSTTQTFLIASVLMQVGVYGGYCIISPMSVRTLVVWMLTRWMEHVCGPLLVWCGWRWASIAAKTKTEQAGPGIAMGR